MRIAIIGVGGVGGYYGGLLARAGVDLTFVARGEQFRALRSGGLEVRSVEGVFKVPSVQVVESVTELANPDVVFVATKTYDRDQVAADLAGVVNTQTVVIPLLNGIDNDLLIKRHIPQAKVYPGLVYIISARTAPGVIEQTAGPRTMLFGERGARTNAQLQHLENVLQEAGILATASPEIEKELWIKFLWLTAFAGMTSICRCSIGPIVNDADGFALYTRCLDEGIAVARALGVRVGDPDRATILAKAEHYRHTASNAKASMLVDIEHQRLTEVEALNGAIVRLAKAHGVSTPIQETIYHAVRLASLTYG